MLEGQLEESMAELEESRRKLINLKMQKDAASAVHSPTPIAGNGNLSPEKPIDKTSLRELKEAIEETKVFILMIKIMPVFISLSLFASVSG